MTFHPVQHARRSARRRHPGRDAARLTARSCLPSSSTSRVTASGTRRGRSRSSTRSAPGGPISAIVVRTSAPRWLFDRTARVPITLVPGECDTGVVQIDSLRLDERADDPARGRVLSDARRRVREQEAAAPRSARGALRRRRTRRRSAARPPPRRACRRSSSPTSPGTGSTKDTRRSSQPRPVFCPRSAPPTVRPKRRGGCRCTAASRRSTPSSTCRSSPGTRGIRATRSGARSACRSIDRSCCRRSGATASAAWTSPRSTASTSYGVVLTHRDGERRDRRTRRRASISSARLASTAAGLRYEDLVAACDIVATKPGYGIIAECIANETAILYTSRGHFVEYDVLVDEMPRYLRCGFIDHDDLFAGRWRAALDQRNGLAPASPSGPRQTAPR